MIRPAQRPDQRPDRPPPPAEASAPAREAPALSPSAPWHLVLGRRAPRAMAAARRAVERHPALAGRALHWHVPSQPRQTPEVAERAAQAASADGGLVVAVGGDGTANAVAQACVARGVPMGVLTLGTFNFFTRQQRLPAELQVAVQALADAQAQGRLRPVSVGCVNGQVFLVNASVGLYPRLLADRERATSRFGRHRAVALLAGLASLLRRQQGQWLRLREHDAHGRERLRMTRASTLFVGNNALQLERVGVAGAEQAGRERLVATTLLPCSAWRTLGLLWQAAWGRLAGHPAVDSFSCTALTVEGAGGPALRELRVAFDGERTRMALPLRFEVGAAPLWLVAPSSAVAARPQPADGALPAGPRGPALVPSSPTLR